MWRAFFLAVGFYIALLGAQCLGVEKFVLNIREPAKISKAEATGDGVAKPKPGPKRTFTPEPWTPWSLMATGVVVCLYTFNIPRRLNG